MISVRELTLRDYLAQKGFQVEIVNDPVFLLSPAQWREIASSPFRFTHGERYILYYNLLNSTESTRFAEDLSRQKGLPIVEITKVYGLNKLGRRYVHDASVPEFLSLIDNADYVVSNSFHGIAVSIILERQFFAVGMGDRAGRALSLLDQLDLSNRYFDASEGLIDDQEIDFGRVKALLSEMVDHSKDYLHRALALCETQEQCCVKPRSE